VTEYEIGLIPFDEHEIRLIPVGYLLVAIHRVWRAPLPVSLARTR
jgi:hypothetical protein